LLAQWRAYCESCECVHVGDEAVAYATLLWKSGVSTELHVWQGAFHGFDMDLLGIVGKEAAVAAASVSAKKSWVRRVFAADTSDPVAFPISVFHSY
jgi:acetyl esterase/lipase